MVDNAKIKSKKKNY